MTQDSAAVDLHRKLRKVCGSCSLAELCLPMGLDRSDVERLEAILVPEGPLHEGDHLFRVGDRFDALYAVRSGYLKTYLIDETGREQVLGFHLPGDLVGLDAIYPERHQCNAVSLDTATVCKLPYGEISELAGMIPSLQKQMFRLISKDIVASHALSGDFTAEERLAAFLLGLSARLKSCGYSATQFILACHATARHRQLSAARHRNRKPRVQTLSGRRFDQGRAARYSPAGHRASERVGAVRAEIIKTEDEILTDGD